MAVIRIPFSKLQQRPGDVAYSQPGEVSGRVEAREIRRVGGQAVNAMAQIDEYQRRRANFTARNLAAEIEIDSDNWQTQQLWRTDLADPNPATKKTGFEQAPEDYAAYLEQRTQQAAAKLPRRFQKDFLATQKIANKDRLGAFTRHMTDLEVAAFVSETKHKIARLATGEGEVDPLTGERQKGTPNPVAAFNYAVSVLPSIRSDKQAEVFDYAAEQTAYGLMTVDPDEAINWLDGMKEAFEPEKWLQLTEAAKSQKRKNESEIERAEKALIKDRFNVVSQALDAGTADGALIYQTYQEDYSRSDDYNEAVRKARQTQFRRLEGANKPDPDTDWSRQQEGQKVVLDYWTGKIEGGKEDAINRLQQLRYEDRVLSSDDYALLREQLDKEYPYDTVKAVQGAFGTAERLIAARYGAWVEGRDELAAEVQRAVLSRIELAQSKGQPISPRELSGLAAELAAGSGPRPEPPGEASRTMRATEPPKSEDIDLTGVPVLKSLRKPDKATQKPKDGLVRMQAPDGTIYEFSVEYEAEARRNGYTDVK